MIAGKAKNIFCALGAALISLAVYIPTLAPGITWGDAGELITASYTFGSAHPSGYPLFCLLGKLFSLIPFGNVAYRYNLFCALSAAFAAAGTAQVVLCLTGNCFAAAAGALTMALSRTVWQHAHGAEVYALHLALVVWVLWAVLRFHYERRYGYLYWAALLAGFALTNHLTSGLLALPVLFIVTATEPQIWKKYRLLAKLLLLVFLPLLLYLYLPLAVHYGSGISWGKPDTWERFWIVVLGKQYHFRFGLHHAAANLKVFKSHMLTGFHPVVLAIAAGGMIVSLRRFLIPGIAFLLGFLAFWGYTLLYNIEDLDAYFMPLDFLVAVWFGVGLYAAGEILRRMTALGASPTSVRVRAATAAAALVTIIGGTGAAADQVSKNWRYIKQAGVDAEEYARSIFDAAKGRTLVITRGDGYTFALWYQKFVATVRKDVTIVDVRMLGMDYGRWFLDYLRRLDPDLDVVYSTDVRYNRDYVLDHNYGKFETVLMVNLEYLPLLVTGQVAYAQEQRGWYTVVRKLEKRVPWLTSLTPVAEIQSLATGPAVENGRLAETRQQFRRDEQIVLFVEWKTLVNHRTEFIWHGPDGQEVLRQQQYTPAEWRYSWAWMDKGFPKKEGKWRVDVAVEGGDRKSIEFIVQ